MFEFHTDKDRYFAMQAENAQDHVLPFIEAYCPIVAGMRVLEIGCAEAGVLKAFTDRGCDAVGVELEESRLELARNYLRAELEKGQVRFISRDIYKIDAEADLNGRFDIIILKDVIEHIPNQEKLIAWMRRLLNPGGLVFFGFPPWQMPFGGHQQLMSNRWLSKLPYFHLLPLAWYKALLRWGGEDVAGFVEIRQTGISIERFERAVKAGGFEVANRIHYLVNPIYYYKFGWKPRRQWGLISAIPYLRNYLTTCVYYLVVAEGEKQSGVPAPVRGKKLFL